MLNRFGTTADMVIQNIEEGGIMHALAIDSKGLYLTLPGRLDTSLADPNRYAATRESVAERLAALGMDPAALLSANQHLIKTDPAAAAKRVNPLKASKRAMKK